MTAEINPKPLRLAALARAVLVLLENLSGASNKNAPLEDDHGRAEAIRTLIEISNFLDTAINVLEDTIATDEISNPLLILSIALKDLEHGSVHPILRPAPVQNRRQLPSTIRMGRGVAAAAMECLMLAGFSAEAAARYVAIRIKGSDLLDNVKRDPWKAVMRWREDIQVETPITLDQWGSNPIARPDVVVYHHYLGVARLRLDSGIWTRDRLEVWANALLVDADVNPFSRKGRAK